jgi:hypothetical protein
MFDGQSPNPPCERPFDGLTVEVHGSPEILWVYKGLYGVTATHAGGIKRTPSVAAYVVIAGKGEAMHGIA